MNINNHSSAISFLPLTNCVKDKTAIVVYSLQLRKKFVSVDCFDPAISFRQIARKNLFYHLKIKKMGKNKLFNAAIERTTYLNLNAKSEIKEKQTISEIYILHCL